MAKRTKSTPGGLATLSVTALHAELRRRERVVGKLQRRHHKLIAKLDALNRQIGQLGGTSSGGAGRGRLPRNEMTLVEALTKALDGKTLSIRDAAEAVQKAGYRTTSANFRIQVNLALIQSGKFKRVERGTYTAK